jgi:hypothetical protein
MSTSLGSDRSRHGAVGFASGQYGAASQEHESGGMVPAACQAVGDAVRHYPASSTLLTVGLGFGLGVFLGCALARPTKQKGAMARFGENVWSAMSNLVPESMKRS